MKWIYVLPLMFLISCTYIEDSSMHSIAFEQDELLEELISQLTKPSVDKLQNVELHELIQQLDKKYIAHESEENRAAFKSYLISRIYGSNQRALFDINFDTEKVIDASASVIWQHLVDIDAFPEWNPFTPRVETTFEIGSPIVMYVRLFRALPDFLIRQPETVVAFNENESMCWQSTLGSAFWFQSYRCYELEQTDENQTIIKNTMNYSGLLASLVYGFSSQSVLDGFRDVSTALKARVED